MSDNDDIPSNAKQQQISELREKLTQLSAGMERLVEDTMESLSERGIDVAELAPLVKLRDAVRTLEDAASGTGEKVAESAPSPSGQDARKGEMVASEGLLARASAIVDILVQSGHSPDHAAQLITRQLLSVGIKLPEFGGDARAWKRLSQWRSQLIHYKRSGPAWDIYSRFKEELASIPAEDRLRRAVGEKLWDLRRGQLASRDTA